MHGVKRRPLAFATGELVGVHRITHPGDPAAYADRRRVAVECTRCRYRSTVWECWLRRVRDGRAVKGCAMCAPGGRKPWVQIKKSSQSCGAC